MHTYNSIIHDLMALSDDKFEHLNPQEIWNHFCIEDMRKVLQEYTFLFKSQYLEIQTYDQICRGLLRLDELLSFEHQEVHRMAMDTFYILADAYQNKRKRLALRLSRK